ncbi:hypothetical protein AJ80_08371 [Polytolypa hystricis UAMH7299]|uniref:SH3 domain-containing protein n=1 Tax=Polytolypa hystricis (strain UAMH7299) TaxID=1447883 RepID=A0A2B7X911_POLH7|nr:hypothetical protein AJ80_08371 [Polytolypa hystricis UAMH7299]
MRYERRIAFFAGTLLLLGLLPLKWQIEDLCDQYVAGAYLASSVKGYFHMYDEYSPSEMNVEVGDKVIVMARLQEEDATWVQEELPDWQRAIYTVNPSASTLSDPTILTTPLNKGRESMAYLTYIIEHYTSLPSTIAFLHAHRSGFLRAWHVDDPLHNNVAAMRSLKLDFVQRNGYVNLRCNWNPGCKQAHRTNQHVTDQIWREVFNRTMSVIPPSSSLEAQKYLLHHPPDQLATPCCAQFAVSRTQVLKRPREDYVRFRDWVIRTDLNDAESGRVMEFLWHVIFGMDAV